MLRQRVQTLLRRSPQDVVILIGRAFKGGFKDCSPEDILMPVMKAAVQRANIEFRDVNDALIGNVLAELGFAKTGRMALNAAGFPSTTTFRTVNRQFNISSSLKESPVKDARGRLMPMGMTSENVAKRYNVDHKAQDEYALERHRRASVV
ncbi:hypothetical protein AJ80_06899 [Polytolypa hystricis UAMH7299]|uniref:Thiolase N-terminal domain-containing protein n=1 Tax=Polytolypa hystricis (strain UAMH7299) TaxID=1447883 RepID=A0A2B7XJM3_POLH7|nr:hypothetical protein AJ80_06899 [Polytolypa hystricis UAMH7299]